ncbi:MAG: ISL3 family transposase [Pseudomonadota bacterium]
MDSVELYRQLLGVTAPWSVQRVDMDVHGLRVDVHLEHAPAARFACPQCGRECSVYDHAAERSWRHLDSCHFQTVLHARAPRVNCSEHGVRLVELPWAEPGGRFTRLFEALAVDVLLATDVKKAATILGITWDEAWNIMERAVVRGRRIKRSTMPELIGVDEKAIAKGHRYMTLVCDLEQATVEYIGDDRRQVSLDAYFDAFDPEALQALRAVCMDMWPPYINACLDKVEQAEQKIVFDRFHIMWHVVDAVDTVRKREHKALLSVGDATLSKSKYLWLYSAENVPPKWHERFNELKGANLKTARAWALKESLRELWDHRRAADAKRFWQRWYFWATHSRLKPMIDAAKMIARHLPNVLTYFTHRISNAMAEGLNSKIATIQKRACGYRNAERFKIAVYFHCGGLNLWPQRWTHSKVG